MSQTPVPITGGTGSSSIAAELVGGTSYQEVEIYGQGGASVLGINSDGSIKASIIGTPTVTFSGSPSISGSVTIVGNPSISGSVGIVGTPSISGTVGASVIGTVPITQGGTFIISGSVATVTAGVSNQSVSGTVGASIIGITPVTAVITGTPSISGAVTVVGTPSISGTVLVNNGSVVGFQGGAWTTSVVGGPITLYSIPGSMVSAVTSVITGTTSVTVLVGAPGGQRNYITHILATNGAATGTFVNIYDGGNVVYAGYAAASGGGFSATLPVPLRQASAQGALCAATTAQGSVVVAVSGYTAT